jgi:hypothetical protein
MTDTSAHTGPHSGADTGATGHAVVDQVLDSLTALSDRPVAEHVSVFEAAHDRLRDALADVPAEPGDSSSPG